MNIENIVNRYIKGLSDKIDSDPKFNLFKTEDPDFNKDILLKEVKVVSLKNMARYGTPSVQYDQILDILKYIKKSNEIGKLLESNNAYITHINEDGTFQYVFTNRGYKILKDMRLI